MEIFRVKRWIISALKNDKRYLLLTTTDYFMKVTNLACTSPDPGTKFGCFSFSLISVSNAVP